MESIKADPTPSDNSGEAQELNAKCRSDFLHFLSCCQGKEASIRVYECSRSLSCKVEAFQPDLKHIAVSDLTTPIGIEKSAIIRSSDLMEVQFCQKE